MKKIFLAIVLIASIVLFNSNVAYAQGDLISTKETGKIMADANVIIVSTRKPVDYAKVHVKDAVNVDILTLCKDGEPKGILKSPADIAKILGSKGIGMNKKVIIYDNGKNINAGRLYWILKYLGYKDVKIMNGHMKAWRAARKPVTKIATKKPEVAVTPVVNKKIYISYADLKAKLKNPKVVVVDVQSAKEYGEGHIPGSINFEYKKIINEEPGTLKSAEAMASSLKAAGITSDKEIILYCATSARAGVVYMALTSILNYPNVKIYDGGWNEWKTK